MTAPKPDPAASLAISRVRIRAHLLSNAARSAASGNATAQHGPSHWIHVLAMLSAAVGTWVPFARLHPVRLVLCAAAAGAAVMWIRPWRWVTAAAAATTLAVAVDLFTQAQSKDNAWSTFMDFVLQKKGPSGP